MLEKFLRGTLAYGAATLSFTLVLGLSFALEPVFRGAFSEFKPIMLFGGPLIVGMGAFVVAALTLLPFLIVYCAMNAFSCFNAWTAMIFGALFFVLLWDLSGLMTGRQTLQDIEIHNLFTQWDDLVPGALLGSVVWLVDRLLLRTGLGE